MGEHGLRPPILVTGATGYVGGRLVPRLIDSGHSVRVLVRAAAKVEGRSWRRQVTVVVGDVLRPETLTDALRGVSSAYYLIHSMTSSARYEEADVRCARNFGSAARAAGVERIIYLGGVGDPTRGLSHHLRSRQRVGMVLRESGIPVTEFQASIIIGSGSASFEMIRYLVEGLPILPCPRWVARRVQPIGIEDVLDYLVAALDTPASAGRVIGIGGRDVLSYHELLLTYARVRGLQRAILSPPGMQPAICAWIVDLLTPIPRRLALPLIEGLRSETVAGDALAHQLFPSIRPLGSALAFHEALSQTEAGRTETSWRDSVGSVPLQHPHMVLSTREGLLFQQLERQVAADAPAVWGALLRLPETGYPASPHWLWRLHGKWNSLIGGIGALRGRRHPTDLRVGDALDYWRVEDLEPGGRLRLKAELEMPGSAWLEFEIEAAGDGESRLIVTTTFAPHGASGILFWHALVPVRTVFLRGLARNLATSAQVAASSGGSKAAGPRKIPGHRPAKPA